MSRYAVSDIHGCHRELMALLDGVGFSDDDELYILGDMIDRGPGSAELVKWLVSTGSNVFYQWGNHEQMMDWSLVGNWADLVLDEEASPSWMRNGGEQTYDQLSKLDGDIISAYQELLYRSPKVRTVHTGTASMVLVHAGLRLPTSRRKCNRLSMSDISEQTEDDLLWITWDWLSSDSELPCDVVFGHMPVHVLFLSETPIPNCPVSQLLEGAESRIMQWKRRHAIDCACVNGGNLGLLRLDDWKCFHQPCLQEGGYWK